MRGAICLLIDLDKGSNKKMEKGKRMTLLVQKINDENELAARPVEAAVRYTSKPILMPSLQFLPVLLPFGLTQCLACIVSKGSNLDLRLDSPEQLNFASPANL